MVLDQAYGPPKITKDGVTVAKHIEFKDKFMNMGAQLVRQVANKANDTAGDGTTTATVLTRAIYSEGCKAVAAGMNPMDLRRGIMLAVDSVVESLATLSEKVESKERITQVATISANSEREIGELIADAMERVGKEGVITVNDGKTIANELDVVEVRVVVENDKSDWLPLLSLLFFKKNPLNIYMFVFLFRACGSIAATFRPTS